MNQGTGAREFRIDVDSMPALFPTHRHSSAFWEALGRVIGTFSFLEEVMGKAIFALTATKRYPEAEDEEAYRKCLALLERALSDPLGGLIGSFEKSARGRIEEAHLYQLVCDLKNAAKLRNVLCHGSWNSYPDDNGRSVPFFVSRENEVFDTAIDIKYLVDVQANAVELACAVISSVRQICGHFPGLRGPEMPL